MDAIELIKEKEYLLNKQRTRGLNKSEEKRLIELIETLTKLSKKGQSNVEKAN